MSRDNHRVLKLLEENRIGYYAPADYTEGSEMDELIKRFIDRTAAKYGNPGNDAK